jgi:voltage-gated potassium channel
MKIDFNKSIYQRLAALAILTLTIGTIVFHYVEKFSWVDAYYFSVITLATVGYGDFAPKTDFGKIFVTFYIMVGVGIITTFISYTMRRRASKIEKRMEKRK